jgi:hypothetical protein
MNAAIAWGSWATWSPQTIDAKKLNRVVLYQASYIVFCNVWRDKFNGQVLKQRFGMQISYFCCDKGNLHTDNIAKQLSP